MYNISIKNADKEEKQKRSLKTREMVLKRMKLKSKKVHEAFSIDYTKPEDLTPKIDDHIEYATCSYCSEDSLLYSKGDEEFVIIGFTKGSYNNCI